MADAKRELSGTQSAAILLMSVGEDHAARIFKHMGPLEVQKVGSAMSSLANISPAQVGGVVQQLVQAVRGQTALGIGSDQYIRKVLEKALGTDKAGKVIPQVLEGASSKGLDAIKWMDPRAVADVIGKEHPQVIAIVLSQLDAEQGAAVLAGLPEDCRADVLVRVARLDEIQSSALEVLDQILETQFSDAAGGKTSGAGGTRAVADMLNLLAGTEEGAITKSISEIDAELGQEIQDLMFVFDDLKGVDDRGMQALLREVSSDLLVVALKGADETISEKIFKNMSTRAADVLRDDLETKGPVKLSEVQAAQKEVLVVAQRMVESGDLALSGKGGEEYV